MPGATQRLPMILAMALVAALAGSLLVPVPAHAQCMIANPSFEYAGSAGATFAGWNQFGPTGFSTNPAHGARSARVTGPNTGVWDVSGFWQPQDCVPGQRWSASVCVLNSSIAPLSGGSTAIVNVEWRDAGGVLISYESYTAADAGTPPDSWRTFSVQSGPAPAGTASIHFVIGVLQDPATPTPQVLFDLANCISLGPPTLANLQWNDFPTARSLSFAGRTWRVKGSGYYGPGPNLFDGTASGVFMDAAGQLNLTIHKVGASWYSSEVALDTPLGYGDYVFTTRGRLDLLDRNTVFGMFLWEYGSCYDTGYLWWNPYNEIDVEFSRWGNAASADAQFVAQPAQTGNVFRFNAAFGDTELVSHAMRWLPHRVEFRSWRGGPDAESAATTLASWTYTGAALPRPENPRVHLNLWQLAAPAVTQTAILNAFTFRPACPGGDCGVLDVAPPPVTGSMLAPAAPNPFEAGTVFRYAVPKAGAVELAVFDLSGRQVRRLAGGFTTAGPHTASWNGLDDAGRRVTPGVYFYRLRIDGSSQSKRVVMLR